MMEMRRKEKEITDKTGVESVIRKATVCRLAFSEDDRPYIVPLCFGYRDNTLYFHSAREGRKLDILKKNDRVCFEMDVDQELVESENACEWTMKFRSVIGFGKASLVEDPDLKLKALDTIMEHYTKGSFQYKEAAIPRIVVIRVDIENMTGKSSGY
jgi:nitroimidazol reductase NimA-like FMN-containing flavoprotein (pyridoxamine 5'-phosphate oxidase superfamily)